MNCHTYFSVYLRRGCVLIAGGTAPDDVAPASSVKPAAPRLHLTLNHLIFHKVLGKGSFGKVGGILPVSQAFPQTSSVFITQNFLKISCHMILHRIPIQEKTNK